MSRIISIHPVTRLEGEGRIDIHLDRTGQVSQALFKAPDYRGFERFCVGRSVEEMPTLTQKICGVCPVAHHLASVKALDGLFEVSPPPAARTIRELMHHAFVLEDHLLHFYYLAGPDLILGPDTPPEKRNLFGVIQVLGPDLGRRILTVRKKIRAINEILGGSPLFPVTGLPGGMAKAVSEEERAEIQESVGLALDFVHETLALFHERILPGEEFAKLLADPAFRLETHSLGMIDNLGQAALYDGRFRVRSPDGAVIEEFEPENYREVLELRTDPWTYARMVYLKKMGWSGLKDGPDSGVFRVGPLARLNAAEGLATPLAQAEYERMFEKLGEKPAHQTMAFHWARLVEALFAAETLAGLAARPDLTHSMVRAKTEKPVGEAVGAVEAPRGALIHDYRVDSQGLAENVRLIVATQNNYAALCLSIDRAAKSMISGDPVREPVLNRVEMAMRAYDPCLACATH